MPLQNDWVVQEVVHGIYHAGRAANLPYYEHRDRFEETLRRIRSLKNEVKRVEIKIKDGKK